MHSFGRSSGLPTSGRVAKTLLDRHPMESALGRPPQVHSRNSASSRVFGAGQGAQSGALPPAAPGVQRGDGGRGRPEEVSDLLDEFPLVVATVITGHDHHYGDARSGAGVYHRILEAAMEGEAPPGRGVAPALAGWRGHSGRIGFRWRVAPGGDCIAQPHRAVAEASPLCSQ